MVHGESCVRQEVRDEDGGVACDGLCRRAGLLRGQGDNVQGIGQVLSCRGLSEERVPILEQMRGGVAENFSVIKGSINACNSGLAKLGSHGVMGLDSGLVEVGYGALEGSSHGVKPNLGWDSSGVKDVYFGFCLDSEAGKLSTLISLANKALLNEVSRFLGTSSDFVFPLGSRASSSPSPFGGGVLAKPLERRARASRSIV